MVGVELDSTTASIARGLYPNAHIRTESFADTRFPRGFFDAAVGNVPFGKIALPDREYNGKRHSIHNHFIIKSLALTRPGGLVALLTSSFTMDSQNSSARREMNELADLVGAVRLPTGAHRRAAGTDAVTDLLIFRRRSEGESKRDRTWEGVSAREIDGQIVKINSYFDTNPRHILGDITLGQGMYGADKMRVTSEDLSEVRTQLRAALAEIVAHARQTGLTMTPVDLDARADREAELEQQVDLLDGTILYDEDSKSFQIVTHGTLEPYAVPRSSTTEVRALIGLRDAARELLTAESLTEGDVPEVEQLRHTLRARYDDYQEKYGPISRYKLTPSGRYEAVVDETTGKLIRDPETGAPARGEEIMARRTPTAIQRFRRDPGASLVKALERFDDETQRAQPAPILTERVLSQRETPGRADTPAEALAMSMNETGTADLAIIAKLLGTGELDARDALGELVYDDPETGQLIPAPEYLSGPVVDKLEAAIDAAQEDPRYAVNVDALRAVQPEPIGIEDIEARLGAVWISPEIHQQFLRELLRDPKLVVENPVPGQWAVRGGNRNTVRAREEWGTDRRCAHELAQSRMSQSEIVVKDKVTEGDKLVERTNAEATLAATDKADAIQERFSEWVWENPERANALQKAYNRSFNATRLRSYDGAGEYLTFPGLAKTFTLRPHQRAAVARMIAEPTVGLFHGVGAGKTLEMIVGATEMRRMGLVQKPCIVVPNHMLEQFTREWLQAYPSANILAASTDDLCGEKRRDFVARVATGDWDGVLMTQSAFQNIGVSPAAEARYLQAQVDERREMLEAAQGEGRLSVKQIETAVARAESDLARALDRPRDPGISFDETGIDYLIVDEAHLYKNLTTPSKTPGVGIAKGSDKATDLHLKLDVLRERGPRVATLATATPIANSITEAYVMQRYLRPDLMQAAGITSFDGWVATFATQKTDMELDTVGNFRMKTRLARFQNVPEMLRMWHTFADVKTHEDLNLPLPNLRERSDGKRAPETVVLEPTPELLGYVELLGKRAEAIAERKVTPEEDNMLKVSSHGRAAALDMRLVEPDIPPVSGMGKVDKVAETVFREWERTRDNEYLDPVTGDPSPVRGGLQLVFCDYGTPNTEGRFSAYAEIRRQLIDYGMPAEKIAFIHDAKSDAQKGRLFQAARAGHIAVLLGSTDKMGVGTNVQTRVTALHHVDCPWRPADLEQRDGRAVRQGNQNDEVGLFRYVVERSFDGYMWQTVARKAAFIDQVMRGNLTVRELDDIGDTTLSAQEATALSSGNPLLLELSKSKHEVARLEKQERHHGKAQRELRVRVEELGNKITYGERDLADLRDAAPRTTDVSGDKFLMRVDGVAYTERAKAAAAIAKWAQDHRMDWRLERNGPQPFAQIAGHTVEVRAERVGGTDLRSDVKPVIQLQGVPRSGARINEAEFVEASLGLVRSIEGKTHAIEGNIAKVERELGEQRLELEDAQSRIGAPFKYAVELAEARAGLRRVEGEIQAQAKDTPDQDSREHTHTHTPGRPSR